MLSDEQIEAHRQLVIELSHPGSVLAPGARTATVRNPAWFVQMPGQDLQPRRARRDMQNQMIAEELARFHGAKAQRKAIVMAGPPGAGKSTIRRSLLGERESEYVRIDADEFKEKLLRQALEDGSYESFMKPAEIRELEEAGERFYPMELASLVHEESSLLATRARDLAIASGVNVIVDTVLSNEPSAHSLMKQLTAAGYSVELVDVEVPYEISEARIAKRWREQLVDAERGAHELGGRWVPSEYARGVFDGPAGRSLPEVIAETIAGEYPAVARFRRYRVTTMETGTEPARGVWEVDRRLPAAADAPKPIVDPRTGPAAPRGPRTDGLGPA